MKTITWNLKIDNRRYDVKYVSSQPYASGGLFVNGDKIANPQSKNHFVIVAYKLLLFE